MSNIDKQALREAAENATPGNWWIDSHGQAMVSFIDNEVLEVFVTDNKRDAVRHEDTGNLSRWRNDNDATFIAMANPATVMALLDELEAAESRIAEVRGYNVDLAEESRQYQQRVSELEAREVKLPEAMMPARHNSGELFMSPDNVEYGGYLNRDDVVRALRAAGIITKVGE